MLLLSIFAFISTLCITRDAVAQKILGSLVSETLGLLGNTGPQGPCDVDHIQLFAGVISNFTNKMMETAVERDEDHFLMSPYSMWMSLAAMAEGANGPAKEELFTILGLPEESCLREKFYSTAVSLQEPDDTVKITGTRLLIVDNEAKVNRIWSQAIQIIGLLNYKYQRLHPESSEEIVPPDHHDSLHFTPIFKSVPPVSDIEGNSIILDFTDLDGVWTTAFAEETIVSNFYDNNGQNIGKVELMTMTKQVRLTQLPFMNAKVLELPIGAEGRYTMLIAMGVKSIPIRQLLSLFRSSVILQVLEALTLNLIPIDIAIPKFNLQSKFDARYMLEDVGVESLWSDPDATRFVSKPPAIPDSLFHRVTLNLGTDGVHSPDKATDLVSSLLHTATSLTAKTLSLVGREFIANKPFTYCLLDTETSTMLIAGVYSDPN